MIFTHMQDHRTIEIDFVENQDEISKDDKVFCGI